MIDDYVAGFAFLLEICDRRLKTGPCSLAIDCRHDNKPGVKLDRSDQFSKVTRVLCNDDAIFLDTARHYAMVRFTPAADMKWVDGVMHSGLVEALRYARRKGLVNEKLHATSTQGRPEGRPIGGCERA